MEKRKATLKSIAEAVGVHVSTVSRALNPETSRLITAELAERITVTARQLGYRPDAIAYSLRTRRSRTVGVILPDITNPIFPPIVRGLEDALSPRGYMVLITNADHNIEKEASLVDTLAARGIDGLIVASVELHDDSFLSLVGKTPVVSVNRHGDAPGLSGVINAESAGISAAVNHLAKLGHRRIAHIAGPSTISTGVARAAAFRRSVAELGLDADPALVVEAQRFSEDEGLRLARHLVRRVRPTAIVAANDLLALGALEGLRQEGVSCPDGMSLTGYNDMPFVDRIQPPLTTVRIPTYETGRRAAEMLLRRMAEPSVPHEVEVEIMPVELIVRGSTGPVPGTAPAPPPGGGAKPDAEGGGRRRRPRAAPRRSAGG